MSNTTTTKTNGQTPKDSAKAAAVMKAVTATAPNPVGNRIQAIAGLQRKVLQLQRLKEIEQDLAEFKLLNSDGDSHYLTIRDAKRNEFETTNAYIIQKAVEAAKRKQSRSNQPKKAKANSFLCASCSVMRRLTE